MVSLMVKAGWMLAIVSLQACSYEAQSSAPVSESMPQAGKQDEQGKVRQYSQQGQLKQADVKPMLVAGAQTGDWQQGENAQAKGEGMLTGELTTKRDAKGLSVTLTVTNPRPVGVAIQYRSGMTADLWLVDSKGTRLWAWSSEMMFTQALRDVVIAANKSFTVKFLVPAKALAKAPKGSVLVAKYAGRLQDSSMQAMADVRLPLLL